MTLGFRTHWPKDMGEWAGKPNHFVEKITNCLKDVLRGHISNTYKPESYDFLASLDALPKIHTIREDKFDRWGAESNIHFVINNRTSKRFQFAPVVKCVSVQKIEIIQQTVAGGLFSMSAGNKVFAIKVDGRFLDTHIAYDLIRFDGFESVEQFFAWFDAGFTGKIIHWTDLKY